MFVRYNEHIIERLNLKNFTFGLFLLVGGFPVNFSATPPFDRIVLLHPELAPGGLWAPGDCIPRQRVAVIIPFRDREEHLRALLYVLHPLLQRQMLDYTIFVVEQVRKPTSGYVPLRTTINGFFLGGLSMVFF